MAVCGEFALEIAMSLWRDRIHSECSVSVINHNSHRCVYSLGLKVSPEQLYNFLHPFSPFSTGVSLHVTHQSKTDVLALDLKRIYQLRMTTLIAVLRCFCKFVCDMSMRS